MRKAVQFCIVTGNTRLELLLLILSFLWDESWCVGCAAFENQLTQRQRNMTVTLEQAGQFQSSQVTFGQQERLICRKVQDTVTEIQLDLLMLTGEIYKLSVSFEVSTSLIMLFSFRVRQWSPFSHQTLTWSWRQLPIQYFMHCSTCDARCSSNTHLTGHSVHKGGRFCTLRDVLWNSAGWPRAVG